jgi:dTDP-4-amino-4,6-dideoxygalactose transaminase
MNARISEIQAAILRIKLRVYPQWLENRCRIARIYDDRISCEDVRKPYQRAGTEPSFHQYVIRCGDRASVTDALRSCNVSYGIHYPVPMHKMPAYRATGANLPSLPVTEAAAEEILSLPIHEALTAKQAETVARVVNHSTRGTKRAAA